MNAELMMLIKFIIIVIREGTGKVIVMLLG